MAKDSCPFLGLKNDPRTYMDFPDNKNSCLNTIKIASPSLEHQTGYCLTASNYKNCQVFTVKKPKTLPPSIISPIDRLTQKNKQLKQILIGSLLIFLISFTIINFNQIISIFAQNKNQPQGINDEIRFLTASVSVVSINTDHTLTPTALQGNTCKIDPDWIEYVIKPTDSIFRISLLFNIPVEEILAANCLGENTYVAPHQVIYLPMKPTPTPTITFSPTNTVKIRYIPPTSTREENPSPRPTKTPVPPTLLPPTAIVITPTLTQIPPTEPPPATPTQSPLSTPTRPPTLSIPTEPNFPTPPDP
jgi:hypothetical protein